MIYSESWATAHQLVNEPFCSAINLLVRRDEALEPTVILVLGIFELRDISTSKFKRKRREAAEITERRRLEYDTE